MLVKELRAQAKKLQIPGYSKMRKEQLVAALERDAQRQIEKEQSMQDWLDGKLDPRVLRLKGYIIILHRVGITVAGKVGWTFSAKEVHEKYKTELQSLYEIPTEQQEEIAKEAIEEYRQFANSVPEGSPTAALFKQVDPNL